MVGDEEVTIIAPRPAAGAESFQEPPPPNITRTEIREEVDTAS